MKDEHQHDVDEAAIRKLIGEEWSMDRIVKFCGHIMADKVRASDKVESPGTVRPEADPANSVSHEMLGRLDAAMRLVKNGMKSSEIWDVRGVLRDCKAHFGR